MTPRELKTSILQLAIRGKLVEQRPEEGNGEELFQKIQKEKEILIKAKIIKKTKKLPDISEDEIPFDIPNSWKWIRVDGTGSWGAGATPPRTNPDYYDGTIPWLKTGDLNDGYIRSVPEAITELALKSTSVRLNPPGSVLIAMYGATIGKLGISDIALTTNQACCACIPFNGIFNLYLFYYLMAMRDSFKRISEGGAQPNISKEKIVMSLIPLPPLAEQKRIVERIEELMPLVDQYEEAWNRLEELNKRFPEDLQKSVLQQAIQGKLVEQRPEEGTGEDLYKTIRKEIESFVKAKKIKDAKKQVAIDEDEIPFEIPPNWKWTLLSEIALKITDGTHHSPPNKEEGPYMYVTAKNIKNDGISLANITYVSKEVHDEIYSRCNPEKGDVLLIKDGATTGVVTVNNLEEPFSLLSSVALIKTHIAVEPWFLVYVLRSELFLKTIRSQMKGTGITRITLKQIAPLLIPLPPFDEQKRIVAKIKELLPLCESLKA